MPLPERILIDTSAFIAMISSDDEFHDQASHAYERMIDREQELWTTSYVLVETIALVHRRLGFHVISDFMNAIEGVIDVFWVDSMIHREAWNRLVENQGRGFSFVDWTLAIASRAIDAYIFTFDSSFNSFGLPVLPR